MAFLILVKENIVCTISINRPLIEAMISILGEREAMKELGRRLKLHRLKRNLSQQHVADLVGISMPTYRKIEAGVGSVEFRHVARALGVLGFSEALHNLIQEPETNLKLNDLLAPERLKASPRTSK
jgi:DNA-binding XRE family transcriptional regulator